MQYHLNGFRSGDPSVAMADNRSIDSETTDVLIVGCGPAGLILGAQMAAFPDIRTRIADRRNGPLEIGQADGIACRSVEMFQAFGFADKVIREGYQVNEVTFWRPDASGDIKRSERIADVEPDLSEMPHIILSQARVHTFCLEVMQNSPHRLVPDWGHDLISLERTEDPQHPVTATFRTETGEISLRARYVVGCDGARSTVRQQIGHTLRGEAGQQLWGVMDVLVTTDFPDIRLKCAIRSAGHGSMLIIPREGGYMVRLYIELGRLNPGERAADRGVHPDIIIARARDILGGYTFDVKEVAWWSAYEIGQRICDRFDDSTAHQPAHIFIAGDACHTHSPKAGQGMNVSMADSFNLGWKLASVLRRQSEPGLLSTYSSERQSKAQELIDFDREMARLFSSDTDDNTAGRFQEYFRKHGRYTAGVETRYAPSVITSDSPSSSLASGFIPGMRFHSAPVTRVADARQIELGHVMGADGRWRIFLFAPAGDTGQAVYPVAKFCNWYLADPVSPHVRCTPARADPDSVIDLRAVFQAGHSEIEIPQMPQALRPVKGRHSLTDYEKIFCTGTSVHKDIFERRGIDRHRGALVIARPDQFVAAVTGLSDFDAVGAFFKQVLNSSE